MKKVAALTVMLALCISFPGCRKPTKRILTEREKQMIRDNVLAEIPGDPNLVKVNVNFDNKIKLLAFSSDKKYVKKGESATVVLYWKCEEKESDDYKILGHLDSVSKRQNLDHDAIGNLYPISEWKPGEVIRDEVTVSFGKDTPDGPARFFLGLYDEAAWAERKENKRMKILDPGPCAHQFGHNRLVITSFQVGDVEKKELKLSPTAVDIVVDGSLDEASWKGAFKTSGKFTLSNSKALPPAEEVEAGVMMDEKNLYLGFKVKDTDLQSPYTDRDSALWSAGENRSSDVVEVFLDPDNDGLNYLELQVSPANVVFDAIFAAYRSPRWQTAKEKDLSFEHAVQIDGSLGDARRDKGYTIEIAIPWEELPDVDARPEAGRKFGLNMIRLSNSGKGAATWSPAGSDFHDFSVAGAMTIAR